MKHERSMQREGLLLRVLWTLGYLLAWGLAETLLVSVIILQLLLRLLNGSPSRVLAQFGDSLSRWLAEVGRFACFHSECKPWPFADWPAARELESEQAGSAAPGPASSMAAAVVAGGLAVGAAGALADEPAVLDEEPATVEEVIAEEPAPIEVDELAQGGEGKA